MSDHLPECPLASDCKHDYYDEPPIQCADCGEECFCDRLRACEQRVLEEEQSHLPAVLFGNGDEKAVLQIRDMAYAAGVQAARDAVAGLPWDNSGAIDPVDALAAIDGLRGGE